MLQGSKSSKKKKKPYNKSTGRNYKKDYEQFQSSEKAKKDRASRNAARRKMTKAGKVKKGDGKDVDHKVPLSKGGSNKKSNLRVTSRSKNRAKKAKKK